MKLYKVIFRCGRKRHRKITEIVAENEERVRDKIISRYRADSKNGLEIVSIEPIRDVSLPEQGEKEE